MSSCSVCLERPRAVGGTVTRQQASSAEWLHEVLPSVSARGVCSEATCVVSCELWQMAVLFAKYSASVQLSVTHICIAVA